MQFVNNIMHNRLARIQDAREEAGQTLVEYGLIIGLVAIACVGALGVLSGKIGDLMNALDFNAGT